MTSNPTQYWKTLKPFCVNIPTERLYYLEIKYETNLAIKKLRDMNTKA